MMLGKQGRLDIFLTHDSFILLWVHSYITPLHTKEHLFTCVRVYMYTWVHVRMCVHVCRCLKTVSSVVQEHGPAYCET